MASGRTRITTNLDLNRQGRQCGYLKVPHSTNRSGWGSLLVPIGCLSNGSGPTVLLTGGNHGDEYEGPLAMFDILASLDLEAVRGRVVVMPALNFPALMTGTRLSPLDGRNMNRAFPGRWNGTITEMLAHYVHEYLLPPADAVIDIHSGGSSMIFAPSVVAHHLDDPRLMRDTLQAALAFGAPFAMLLRELDDEGMLDTAVESQGKLFLSTEIGGGAFVTPQSTRLARDGVLRVLQHLGVVDQSFQVAEADSPSRVVETPAEGGFLMAERSGLYQPTVEVGEAVEAGQTLGCLHSPDEPGAAPAEVAAAIGGYLMTRPGRGWVNRGDTVVVLAQEAVTSVS